MLCSICFLVNGEQALIQWFCFCILLLAPIETRQIRKHANCVRVILSEPLLRDCQCSLQQWLRFRELPLLLVERRQVVRDSYCGGILGTQLLFIDRKSTHKQRFSLLVVALIFIEVCQVREADGYVRMIWIQL